MTDIRSFLVRTVALGTLFAAPAIALAQGDLGADPARGADAAITAPLSPEFVVPGEPDVLGGRATVDELLDEDEAETVVVVRYWSCEDCHLGLGAHLNDFAYIDAQLERARLVVDDSRLFDRVRHD